MIITETPFRMSFFGGGTDMEDFFREYGGAVLSTTLVYHSFHPTLYVLFLITFTNTSTERLGWIRKFK